VSAPRFWPSEAGQWEALKEKLTAEDNLSWLLTLICWRVEDVFRAFQANDPLSKSPELTLALGHVLYRAVIEKLKSNLPKDSHRDEATLIRWYPERTATLLEQASGFLIDTWRKDVEKNPSETLVTRCPRVLPRLTVLPNARGRSIHGETAELFILEVYEIAMELMENLPAPGEYRKEILTQITQSLDLQQGTAKRPIPHVVAKIFLQGRRNNWTGIWSSLSRSELAREIALRARGNSSNTSPKHLLNHLKKLRDRAAALKRLFPNFR
jgi:hypothetical protein